jgi:hypothetical protein
MKLSFGNMTVELNIFDISRQPFDYEGVRNACAIEEIVEETINEPIVEDQLGNVPYYIWRRHGPGNIT